MVWPGGACLRTLTSKKEVLVETEAKRTMVLGMSTLAFATSFAVWVLFSIIGKPIQQELTLSNAEFGILIAAPILTGSLARPFLGALGDRFGGRRIFFLLMIGTLPPLCLVGLATEFWHFIVLGFWIGFIGASFAVGIGYVAKWYPPERQGFAMGVFGAGNVGTAITQFAAPILITAVGWRTAPLWYAVAFAVVAVAFLAFTYADESHRVKTSFRTQFSVLKDPKVWRYFQYYSLTFGGFVGLALWMPSYYMTTYGFTLAQAGILVALSFALPGSLIRAYGGRLADKYGAYKVTRSVTWVAWFALFLMAYPDFDFVIGKDHGGMWAFEYRMPWWGFTTLLTILGFALGIGNAAVFKCAANNFPHNAGAVFGSIGLGGGVGGFLLPIIFGALYDFFDFPTICFWFLWGVASVSLAWLYWATHHGGCACAQSSTATCVHKEH